MFSITNEKEVSAVGLVQPNTLVLGDCLEVMKYIPDGSVDLVLTDIPYGTTACKWDSVIPFEPMWAAVKHVLKPRGVFVTTASQPFTSALIMSNIRNYKHSWVWNKKLAGNAIFAKKQPLKIHEDIVVFSFAGCLYYPQMRTGKLRKKNGIKNKLGTFGDSEITENDQYYPTSILQFSNAGLRRGKVHLSQKPVALYEYLVHTYTNDGDTVLDFTMGSGTTGVACVNTNRKFIGIELDRGYFDIAVDRINAALATPAQGSLF